MICRSFLFLLAFLLGINFTAEAQNLAKHIPGDITFVTTFNPSALNAKIPFSKLKEFDFYKMGVSEMAKAMGPTHSQKLTDLFNEPSKFGIDLMTSSHIFGKVTAEGNAFSFMFKLSDAPKFDEFLKSTLPQGLEVVSENGFNMISPEQDMALAWNNEYVFVSGVELHRKYDDFFGGDDYYYEEEEYYDEDFDYYYQDEDVELEDIMIDDIEPVDTLYQEETDTLETPETEERTGVDVMTKIEGVVEPLDSLETEEGVAPEEEYEFLEDLLIEEPVIEDNYYDEDWAKEQQQKDDEHAEKEKEFLMNWVNKVINTDEAASMMKNPRFVLSNTKKTDANLWLDYIAFYQMYMDRLGPYASSEDLLFFEMMQSMYEGTYLSLGVNFDPGAVNFNVDSYVNQQVMKFYRESTDAKFNKKFHKYLPAENLMGYWNFNINFEKTVEGYRDLFMPMIKSIPNYGAIAEDVVEIMDIFIDEDAIYDLWKGDIMFAVTGLKEFEKTITTFEYDEDFNRTETQKTVTEKLPEFIMMSSYKNEDNVRKFLKLGESAGVLENKGSYYRAVVPNTELDMYFALHKNIFFFTNNLELIENKLNKGYAKKERISKAQCKQLKNNSMVFYWNIPKTLNSASAFGIPLAGPQDKILNVSKNSFESIVWTAPKRGENAISQKMSFNFVNKEMNAMEQIFHYLNEVVLMMMSGNSM